MRCVCIFDADENFPNGFTVPAGETWVFDPNVTTTVTVGGNVVVEGTLEMRPANAGVVHTLRFEGVNRANFVGGHTTVPLATDVGLWVSAGGVLDAQGTPKAGWNRTGDDPTWSATDELIAAPNAAGNTTTFNPFTKGGAVPVTVGPGGVNYPTEIANLTRNVRIEGTATGRAHIMFMHCTKPQTLRHVGIRWMAPAQPTGETYTSGGVVYPVTASVLGRYGLHFHKCEAGTQGSLVEGVVIRDTHGPAFVPHESHGMTFRDCVAYDIRDAGFWWDDNTLTNDLLWDRCAVLKVSVVPPFRGFATRGFLLGAGTNMTIRDCVAVGVQGNKVNAGGFHWPSAANFVNNMWTFGQGNVAHNNRGPGVSSWQNDSNPHLIENFVSYNNTAGLAHGAYVNAYTYRDLTTFGNTVELEEHAVGGITFERAKFNGGVSILGHSLASTLTTRFINCTFTGQITIKETGKAGVFRFESTSPATDLTPAKFTVVTRLSTFTVVNSDGSTFQVV